MATDTTTIPTNTMSTTTPAPSGSTGQSVTSVPPAEPILALNERPHITYPRIRMPVVTNTNIEAWFASMNHWFNASGIFSDQQRYDTILAAIDPNVLAQLSESLQLAPADGKYEFAKQILVAHFADSEQRKLNRLLSEMPLGDKRPSELFHDMKRVAGNVLGEAALKGLWTQRLPEAARPVIAASSGTAADFTKIADSIVDALAPRNIQQVAAAPLNELGELKAVIAELQRQISGFPHRSRSRSRAQPNQRPRTPANTASNANTNSTASNPVNADPELCWYHQVYGRDARKCRSPCRRQNRSRTPAPAAVNENNTTA